MKSTEKIIENYRNECQLIKKVNSERVCIDLAFLTREFLGEYKAEVFKYTLQEAEREECLRVFCDVAKEISILGILAYINDIRLMEPYLYSVFAPIQKSCLEQIWNQYDNITADESNKLTGVEAMVFYFSLLLCVEAEPALDRVIEQYVNDYLKKYRTDKLLKMIYYWLIGGHDIEALEVRLLDEKLLVPEKDMETRMAALVYFLPLLSEEQINYYSNELVRVHARMSQYAKELYKKYVDYLLKNNLNNSLQSLLAQNEYYDLMGEVLGYEEAELDEYLLRIEHPERIIYMLYVKKFHMNLEKWWEYIKSLDYLSKDSLKWAEWLYVLEEIALKIEKEGIESEEEFFDTYEDRIKSMPPYPYDETEYIKKICVIQSTLFCLFFREKWNVERLCKRLGDNNMFLYKENDKYYRIFPRALVPGNEDEVAKKYEQEIKGFKEICKSPEQMVKIYMNTNLRFVYSIKRFVFELEERFPDANIKELFAEYSFRAKIVICEPNIRARNKVYVVFTTVYNGWNDHKSIESPEPYIPKKYLCVADELWCEGHGKDIWSWEETPIDCICHIHYYKKTLSVVDIEVGEESKRELDESAEMDKFLDWMDVVIKEKKVYYPYYFWGNNKAAYMEYKKEGMDGNQEFAKEKIYVTPPAEVNKTEEFALKILEVINALKDNEGDVKQFLKIVGQGSLDNINEYKFLPGGRNNGGALNNTYQLIFNANLSARAKTDLQNICKDSSLSPECLANVYMNTYLKQYVSVVDFFTCLKRNGKWLDISKFISDEYRDEKYHRFTFCLKYQGEREDGIEFVLFPPYEDGIDRSGVRWIYEDKTQKLILDENKEKGEKVGRGSILRIDFQKKVIYLKTIYSTNKIKKEKRWDDLRQKFNDLSKCRSVQEINRTANEIKKKMNTYYEFNYFWGNRLLSITEILCKSFDKYRFDMKKCKEALKVFEKVNPYFDLRTKAKNLLDSNSKFIRMVENSYWRFIKFTPVDSELIDIFEVYYKSFYYLCIDRERFLQDFAQQRGVMLKAMENQDSYFRDRLGIELKEDGDL